MGTGTRNHFKLNRRTHFYVTGYALIPRRVHTFSFIQTTSEWLDKWNNFNSIQQLTQQILKKIKLTLLSYI